MFFLGGGNLKFSTEYIDLPPNRYFGALCTGFFLILGLYVVINKSETVGYSLFFAAVLFAVITTVKPELFAPLNRFWMLLGFALGRVVSPLIVGGIFFLLISPLGLFFRLAGRDELRLRSRARSTFWVRRVDVITDDSFKNQF